MIYQASITTSANTIEANRDKTTLQVNKGLVYRVEVFFPAGCAGLCYCQICDGNYQAWPSTPQTYFHGDALLIAFDDIYHKQDVPYEFDIYTYNLDDTYDHTIDVRIGLLAKEIYMARFVPTIAYEYLLKVIDALSKTNIEDREKIIDELTEFIKV